MAAANGHNETVLELLKVNNELCNRKGKDGMTPLHCACTKGRVETIIHLLAVSCISISEGTIRGETALHVAVKNNQFQALETLMEWLKNKNQLEIIINLMDEDGNTILHLAAARRNRQMLELLLKCNVTNPGMLEINAKNHRGLTAFDLILLFPCETSDRDIEMVLKNAGAESSSSSHQAEIQVSVQSEQPELDNNMSSTPRNLSREEIMDWREYFKFKWEGSDRNRVRSDLLVVAVLMATATYQAVLSPPGGLSDEDDKKGQANLASQHTFTFFWFIFFNSAGFYISLITLMILTYNYPLFWELYVAILAMAVTYGSAIKSISPPGSSRLFLICLSSVMPLSIYFWCRWRRGPFA